MSQSYKVRGVVLKRIVYKDYDRILTLFTRERGKITVIAKGARKATSKRLGHLELFNQIDAVIYPGFSLDVLGETSLMSYFSVDSNSDENQLSRIMAAYHLSELIDVFVPDEEPHESLFDWLLDSFHHLHQPHINSLDLTRAFKYRLLQTLGYWPHEERPPADIDQFLETVLEKPLRTHGWAELSGGI